MKQEKAKRIVQEKKIKVDMENDKRIYFTADNHSIYYDKTTVTWNCDCRYYSIKQKTCSHILAAKELWETKIRNKAGKELQRVNYAIKELTLIKKEQKSEELLTLITSYQTDAQYFHEKGNYLECAELCSYIFGLLDSAARLGYINPGKAAKHYKI